MFYNVSCHSEHREESRLVPWQSASAGSFVAPLCQDDNIAVFCVLLGNINIILFQSFIIRLIKGFSSVSTRWVSWVMVRVSS